MSTPEPHKAHANDRVLTRIIVAIILVAVLNAGITLAMAFSIQNKYDAVRAQQLHQSQVVVAKLCTTLNSLHADDPPTVNVNTSDASTIMYLQGLHERLGELASDIKC